MMKVGRFRLWMGIVLSLIICAGAIGSVNAALFGLLGSSKKKGQAVVRQALVVFPFDQSAAVKVPEGFGTQLAVALREQLSGSGYFSAYSYTERLAPIQRGKEDNTLKAQDIAAPFSEDKAKSLKLARLLGTEVFMVGSVEDFEDNTNDKTAQMTVSAQLFNVKSGKLVKTFLVTGHGASADSDDRMALAAGDAVVKLKADLGDSAPVASSGAKNTEKTVEASTPAPAVTVHVDTESSGSKVAITKMPAFSQPLKGRNDLFIRNGCKFSVKVGVRIDGRGADCEVGTNSVYTASLPDGKFEVYVVYANNPDVVVPAKSFSLKGTGGEIEITPAGAGEYSFRAIKQQ